MSLLPASRTATTAGEQKITCDLVAMGKANYPRSTGTKGVFTASGRFRVPLSHRHRRRRRGRGEPSESTPKAEIVIQSPALLLLEKGRKERESGLQLSCHELE
jgi:hypothetical protein